MWFRFVRCFVASVAVTAAVNCSGVSSSPMNLAVVAEDDVTMQCPVNATEGGWFFEFNNTRIALPNDQFPRHTVFQDRLTPVNGTTLSIVSTQSTDAGLYICLDLATLVGNTAHLIVIDAMPDCSAARSLSPSASDTVELTCSMVYSGWWNPAAAWQHVDAADKILSEATTQNSTASAGYKLRERAVFRLSVHVNATTMNNTQYQCRIYFDIAHKPHQVQLTKCKAYTADNAPAYIHVWTSEQLTVNEDNGGNSWFATLRFELVSFGAFTMSVLIITIAIGVICKSMKLTRHSKTEVAIVPTIHHSDAVATPADYEIPRGRNATESGQVLFNTSPYASLTQSQNQTRRGIAACQLPSVYELPQYERDVDGNTHVYTCLSTTPRTLSNT